MLRTFIQQQRWKSGSVLPSFQVLARELKVSYGTIRQAIEILKQENRLKTNAWRRLVVLPQSDSPMDGRDMILVVVPYSMSRPELDNAVFELLKGITAGAGKLGVPFMVAHAYGFEDSLPTPFLSRTLKGIVLLGAYTRKCLAAYGRLSVPVVLADHPPTPFRIHSVSVDNFQAARDATARLLRAGHRRIAFVRRILYQIRDVDPDSKERQQGFMQAFRDARLKPDSKSVFNIVPERGWPAYPIEGIFSARPRFTAALCVDPHAATVVERAARTASRRIPEDFGLICFQSCHETAPVSGPASDFVKIGLKALLLFSEPHAKPQCQRVETAWKERGSFAVIGIRTR